MDFLTKYWPALLLGAWLIYRYWEGMRVKRLLPELRRQGAVFLDVRSAAEFATGSAPGTMNIPLQELRSRVGEIPKTRPVVVCCASGTRSAMAKALLKRSGYTQVFNAGSWMKLLG